MAEEERKPCPLLVDRRSLLRGGAAFAVTAAFADGCTTSETVDVDNRRNAGGGGGGGATSNAGSGGQSQMGDALGGSSGTGTGGTAGASGAGGAENAGGSGGAGGGSGASGPGGSGGGGGAAAKSDGGSGDAGGGLLADCPSTPVTGKAKSVAMGALVSLGSGVVVGRDAGGLYAMTSICTHQGCGLNIVGSAPHASLHCPCHGSSFSATGAVTNGPARAPLFHYALAVSASGDLAVCPNELVDSTTRTPG